MIIDTGALENAETLIDKLTAESLAALDAADVDDTSRAVLHGLAIAATARSV